MYIMFIAGTTSSTNHLFHANLQQYIVALVNEVDPHRARHRVLINLQQSGYSALVVKKSVYMDETVINNPGSTYRSCFEMARRQGWAALIFRGSDRQQESFSLPQSGLI